MKALGKDAVTWLTADEGMQGQRIDNLLARVLKGVPRAHIYRLVRSGQVRVNSGRVDATYRLKPGDRVRLPPVRVERKPPVLSAPPPRSHRELEHTILYEDEHMIAMDKPAGLAVHGGSGISQGVIETMRQLRPRQRFLELVHRLDRDTSGVLLLAKKRAALLGLHDAIRNRTMRKFYQLLVLGAWHPRQEEVSVALERHVLASGDRRVSVSREGQPARTIFTFIRSAGDFSLLEAELLTGRTHQIRVHAAHCGHPIAGDDKYGDFERNKRLARHGLKRMFLHAGRIEVRHPVTDEPLRISAPLAPELAAFLRQAPQLMAQKAG